MLTNATVKAARPRARPYKMGDAGGLFILVLASGSKSWRMKYRRDGREQLLTFGTWPDVDLGTARDRRDQARAMLDRGADPRGRAIDTKDTSFEAIARRWHEKRRSRWSAEHAADVIGSLERHVFPVIGATAIAAIGAHDVLAVLHRVEERGRIETARRLLPRISAVFRLAMLDGLAASDPAATVQDELASPPSQKPQPALTSIEDARALLAAADQVDAAIATKLASRLLALTAVRLACVRGLRWSEIEQLDGPTPLWRIPAERMKLKKAKKADPAAAHLVPLSRQAVAILRRAAALRIHNAGDLVFPGRAPGRPIGEAAIGALYDRADFGGRHVPHGWRATFSTVMNDSRPGDRVLIDRALAHSPKDRVEAAYNRAEHLELRRDLFQRWADLLLPG